MIRNGIIVWWVVVLCVLVLGFGWMCRFIVFVIWFVCCLKKVWLVRFWMVLCFKDDWVIGKVVDRLRFGFFGCWVYL